VVDPTGISSRDVRKTVAELRALGEIMNVPPPQLDPIIDRARKDLTEQPTPPPKPPTP